MYQALLSITPFKKPLHNMEVREIFIATNQVFLTSLYWFSLLIELQNISNSISWHFRKIKIGSYIPDIGNLVLIFLRHYAWLPWRDHIASVQRENRNVTGSLYRSKVLVVMFGNVVRLFVQSEFFIAITSYSI